MNVSDTPMAQKLMQSFMRFRKLNWYGRTSAGHKPSDIRVMFCIKNGTEQDVSGMRVSEISHRLHVTAPTITQLIKGLEANGWVERTVDEKDKRAIRIKLTVQGDRTIQEAKEALSHSFHGLIEYLGEEQSIQLAELLSKVCTYYGDPQSRTMGDDKSC